MKPSALEGSCPACRPVSRACRRDSALATFRGANGAKRGPATLGVPPDPGSPGGCASGASRPRTDRHQGRAGAQAPEAVALPVHDRLSPGPRKVARPCPRPPSGLCGLGRAPATPTPASPTAKRLRFGRHRVAPACLRRRSRSRTTAALRGFRGRLARPGPTAPEGANARIGPASPRA